MYRKGFLSGFTTLQWGLILIIALFLFTIILLVIASAEQERMLGEVHWEAQWLAISVAQYPIQNQQFISYLEKNTAISEQEFEERVLELFSQLHIPRGEVLIALVTRDRFLCVSNLLRTEPCDTLFIPNVLYAAQERHGTALHQDPLYNWILHYELVSQAQNNGFGWYIGIDQNTVLGVFTR